MKTLFILIILQTALTAQTREVTLSVKTDLPETAVVYLTGSTEILGNWDPTAVPLEKINSNTWSNSFTFNEEEEIEFKFTLGDWEHEALNERNEVPGNNKLRIDRDTTLFFTVTSWGARKDKKIYGQITGNVEYIRNFKTTELKSRDIIIWLPPDYYKSDQRYPVLYAHDGQNIIDPATSSFGFDWQMDEAADTLIKRKEIEPLIIVGIYNTSSRTKEYSDTDTGHTYINFIINDLMPLINSRYRTLPDNKNTAVIGSSSGGLITFIMLWEYPEYFSKGACLSPAFAYRDFDYTRKVEQFAGARKDISVYISNGGGSLDKQLQPGVDKMLGVLNASGYKEGADYKLVVDPEAEHNESAWAKRFPEILKFLFGRL